MHDAIFGQARSTAVVGHRADVPVVPVEETVHLALGMVDEVARPEGGTERNSQALCLMPTVEDVDGILCPAVS